MDALVLLPDHLHMLWTLPPGDTDYSTRISVLKKRFTIRFLASGGIDAGISSRMKHKRLRGLWQSRFWEHTIRDARDFQLHMDYIHSNPVKHGLVQRPIDWQWSSFHRHVEAGHYEPTWCGRVDLPGQVEYFQYDK